MEKFNTDFDDIQYWQDLRERQQGYARENWSYWLADSEHSYHRPKALGEALLGVLEGKYEQRLSLNQIFHRLEPHKETWWIPLYYVDYLKEMSHWPKPEQEAEINRLIAISKEAQSHA